MTESAGAIEDGFAQYQPGPRIADGLDGGQDRIPCRPHRWGDGDRGSTGHSPSLVGPEIIATSINRLFLVTSTRRVADLTRRRTYERTALRIRKIDRQAGWTDHHCRVESPRRSQCARP